ncbi:MAG: PD-(D/E)XK nuclease family protein [Elusimicrobia bacterium]|nr:PD-(D/E)XK nuclease family protein [Elusimicrobiota bacterium]
MRPSDPAGHARDRVPAFRPAGGRLSPRRQGGAAGQPDFWEPGARPRPQTRLEADASRKFSPSKLATYRDCPRRYRYRYLDGIRRRVETVETLLGSCVHKALERLYDGRLRGRRMSLAEVLAEFDAAWDGGWSDAVVIRDPSCGPQPQREAGRDCLRWYYEAYSPFDGDQTLGVEKRLGFPLEAGGATVRIEGIIDRLAQTPDGAYAVHDYKTTANLPTQAELDADWQLGIYDIAVRRAWPSAREVALVWHFARFRRSDESRRSQAQRRELLERLAALVSEILGDHRHAPRRGQLCGWCEYRDLCPLWAAAESLRGLSPARLKSDEGAALAGRYAELEAARHRLKDDLRRLELEIEALERDVVAFAEGRGLRGEAAGGAGESVLALACPEGELVVSRKDGYRVPSRAHFPELCEAIEAQLRAAPLWKEAAHLDLHRVMERYERGEWDAESRAAIERVLGEHQGHFAAACKTAVRFHRRKEPESE